MKKLLLLFTMIFAVSCGSREDEPTPVPSGPVAGTLQHALLGTWKAIQYVSSSTPSGGPIYSDAGSNNWYFTNTPEGIFKIQTRDHYFEGNYTYSGGGQNYHAVFTKVGAPYLEIFVKQIEGNIYTFQMQGGTDVTPFTFKAVKQ